MRVGFIGLGIMGSPMAINLVKAGHDVVGYNRNPAKSESLVASGGRAGANIADAVRGARVVITMLPDSPDVESVVLGADGLLAHAEPGCLWIDTSTIDPSVARSLALEAKKYGVRSLDAPVSGGETGAINGTLSIMVGGENGDVAAAQEILGALGSTVVHVGPHGAGQTVKAANQLIVAGTIQLVAEALIFLEAEAVDTDAAVRVLSGGLAGNRILDRKAAAMLARDFHPGFRLDLHHKDLGIFMEAARRNGVVVPAGSLVTQLVASLVARGQGQLDHGALLQLVEDLSGRSSGANFSPPGMPFRTGATQQ